MRILNFLLILTIISQVNSSATRMANRLMRALNTPNAARIADRLKGVAFGLAAITPTMLEAKKIAQHGVPAEGWEDNEDAPDAVRDFVQKEAGSKVRVKINSGTKGWASHKDVIFVPRVMPIGGLTLEEVLKLGVKYDIDSARGSIAHEMGHVKHDDFTGCN